jgi:hypothetical protein
MKILVTGWRWHDQTAQAMLGGFRDLGHKVEFFFDDPKHWYAAAVRYGNRTPFAKKFAVFEGKYRAEVGRRFLEKVDEMRPDFIFVVAGMRFARLVIEEARSKFNVPIANFVVDDPAFAGRTLLYDLGGYDRVFVIDRAWMPVIEFFNPSKIHWLPHAGDPAHFKPLDIERKYDIVFGGSIGLRMPNGPAGHLRSAMLAALADAGFHIGAFINGASNAIKTFPSIKKIDYYDGYKDHDALNHLYNQGKIVLCAQSPQLKGGVSSRMFDGALTKTFQLVEFKPEVPELLGEGEAVCYKNLTEMVSLARQYLADDASRERIARAGYERTLRDHIPSVRMKKVLDIMNLG